MWCPKLFSWSAGALCAAGQLGNPAQADETGPATTPAPATLRTVIRSEEIPDTTNAKPLRRAFFSAGTNRFAFVVPEDFQLDAAIPGKIILTSPDYFCFITIQLVSAATSEDGGMVIRSYRNQALNEFPLGTISNEFELRAANHSGPAYELRWNNPSGASQLACASYIPCQAGVLKFTLLSNAEHYSKNLTHFRCLLRSFQNNESGKLEIIAVSGAS